MERVPDEEHLIEEESVALRTLFYFVPFSIPHFPLNLPPTPILALCAPSKCSMPIREN